MMFRQGSRLLAGSVRLSRRPVSTATEVPAATTTNADSGFIESWKKVIPNIDPPKTPSHFMNPRPATPSSIPSKITVNFVLPYASELSTKEVRCLPTSLSHFLDFAYSFWLWCVCVHFNLQLLFVVDFFFIWVLFTFLFNLMKSKSFGNLTHH